MEAQAPQRSAEMIYSPPLGDRLGRIALGYSADGLLTRYQTNSQAVDITGGRDEEGAESGTSLADLAANSLSLSKKKHPTQM